MTYQDVIKHFGSVSAVASELGISVQSVYLWEKHGVPKGRQWELEVMTDGALKADPEKRKRKAA